MMHNSDPTSSDSPVQKPIPLWVGVLALGVILISGAGLIWKYIYQPPAPPNAMRAIVPAPGGPRVATNNPAASPLRGDALLAAAEASLADGAYPREGHILFKAGDAYLRAAPADAGAANDLRFGYFTVTEAEWEHGYLTQGVRRILGSETEAKELGVTADQIKKLEALPLAQRVKWSAKEMETFAELFKAWKTASVEARVAQTKVIVEALRSAAEPKRAAETKAMTERVAQIKMILDEKQVGKLNPIPKWDFSGEGGK